MRNFILFVITAVCFSAIVGCGNSESEIPECSLMAIEAYSPQPACGKQATIEKYTFQDETVFLLNFLPCAENGAIDVVDGSCNQLGFLGGKPNNKMVNGVDFYANATLVKVLWESEIGVRADMEKHQQETHDHDGDGHPDH